MAQESSCPSRQGRSAGFFAPFDVYVVAYASRGEAIRSAMDAYTRDFAAVVGRSLPVVDFFEGADHSHAFRGVFGVWPSRTAVDRRHVDIALRRADEALLIDAPARAPAGRRWCVKRPRQIRPHMRRVNSGGRRYFDLQRHLCSGAWVVRIIEASR